MEDRFELEGVTYYQQYRKCGKDTCTTCSGYGPGHGPYWYSRDKVTGARSYVGKDLPAAVASARERHDRQLTAMLSKRRQLASQFDALSRLIRNDPLHDGDRETLQSMGFGDCLVPWPAGLATQEE